MKSLKKKSDFGIDLSTLIFLCIAQKYFDRIIRFTCVQHNHQTNIIHSSSEQALQYEATSLTFTG